MDMTPPVMPMHDLHGELQEFRATARRFVAAELVPHEARWAAQMHVDRTAWKAAGALGLLLPDIPETYGGGGGKRHQAAVAGEFAKVESSGGFLVHSIVAHYILNQGTEEQRRKYLPLLATGEMIGAIAMTEPGAGSDLQGIRTRAVPDGNALRLNGTKTFIINGSLADLGVVPRTGEGPAAKNASLLLLETKGADGFQVGRILDKIGQKNQDTSELFCADVCVPGDAILGGEPGHGFGQLMTELLYERVLIGLAALAAIERPVELTLF